MPKEKVLKNEEDVQIKTVEVDQDIQVLDPEEFRPTALPLIITLPETASMAQKEFAKVLNAYAYKNRAKWLEKKDDRILPNGQVTKGLLTQLKELKNAPDPVQDIKLSFRNKLID